MSDGDQREDQNIPLNPDRQRRDGGQEALGRVVQGLEGEGRLIPLVRVDRSKACPARKYGSWA